MSIFLYRHIMHFTPDSCSCSSSSSSSSGVISVPRRGAASASGRENIVCAGERRLPPLHNNIDMTITVHCAERTRAQLSLSSEFFSFQPFLGSPIACLSTYLSNSLFYTFLFYLTKNMNVPSIDFSPFIFCSPLFHRPSIIFPFSSLERKKLHIVTTYTKRENTEIITDHIKYHRLKHYGMYYQLHNVLERGEGRGMWEGLCLSELIEVGGWILLIPGGGGS